ncbi:MAG: phosphoribosylanthranilate isomerase [Candidatus Cohnella colombiensis]|uniref:N-(5'-phosphoribosyl)anthranilate isomerase n=1 Tax=Candidatus Cohnella colombiensis TaxID=3121368 RepID=A0AA95EZC1_9BACL|nr:MAG: phosphoribosylanthranilate isomerase [Cohnella sp.]
MAIEQSSMISRDSTATAVKICGIKEEATLQGMRGLAIDYIGLMFAPSKRQVTLTQAGELREAVQSIPMAGGKPPRTVGVFVNPTWEQLQETVTQTKLDVVQLHGNETPEFCRRVRDELNVEVWRALSVGSEEAELGAQRLTPYRQAVTTILLDTAGGGTGQTFGWDAIPTYQKVADELGLTLFIAGGLNENNADQLIQTYHPQGVDLSSGVETNGVKDNTKITAFVERVKQS